MISAILSFSNLTPVSDISSRPEDKSAKRFHCAFENCEASFRRSDDLSRHERVHTGCKPFKCPQCELRFSRSDHLNAHVATHAGQKPFACAACGHSFLRPDRLRRHVEKNHPKDESLLATESSSQAEYFGSNNDEDSTPAVAAACQVCGGDSKSQHYGATACHKCAAFFRRTVSEALSYKCTCRMPHLRQKKGCRHCRFQRCLAAGMVSTDVKCAKPPSRHDETLLSMLVGWRNRLYATRSCYLSKASDLGLESAMISYANILLVEYQVLSEFLHDFSLATDCFKPGVSALTLTDHFFAAWLSFEVLLATARHARSDLEICFMDSTTAFFGTYDWLVDFHRSQCIIRDPESLANHTVSSVTESLHLARITKRIRLDEHEVAALFQLMFAYYEKELFRDAKAHQSFVNRTLKELHAHYKSTYSEYHERLAALMAVMGEFHKNLIANDEYITLLELYSTISLDNFEQFDQFMRYSNSLNGIWRSTPAKAALALGNVHALRRSVTY